MLVFISTMSSGFDLSSLFESKRRAASMFTSRCSAAAIMAKIELMGREARLRVCREKEFKVRMEGTEEGRNGRLTVAAEVFEVALGVAVVEGIGQREARRRRWREGQVRQFRFWRGREERDRGYSEGVVRERGIFVILQ